MKKIATLILIVLLLWSSKSYAENLGAGRWAAEQRSLFRTTNQVISNFQSEKVDRRLQDRLMVMRKINKSRREIKQTLSKEARKGDTQLADELAKQLRALERIRTSA